MFSLQCEKDKTLNVLEVLEKELIARAHRRCIDAGRLQATKHLLLFLKSELKDLNNAYLKNDQALMRCKNLHRNLFK